MHPCCVFITFSSLKANHPKDQRRARYNEMIFALSIGAGQYARVLWNLSERMAQEIRRVSNSSQSGIDLRG